VDDNCFIYGKNRMAFVLFVIRKSPNSLAGTTTTSFGELMAAATKPKIGCYFILIAIDKSIARSWKLLNRVPHRAFERLEPCLGKLGRTVLRGLRVSNDPRLPDKVTAVWLNLLAEWPAVITS
jgi:hypothetical protein